MELKDTLVYKKKNSFEIYQGERAEAVKNYAKAYTEFINTAKTEREAVVESIKLLEANGFTEYKLGDKVSAGDKKYYEGTNTGIRRSDRKICTGKFQKMPS